MYPDITAASVHKNILKSDLKVQIAKVESSRDNGSHGWV